MIDLLVELVTGEAVEDRLIEVLFEAEDGTTLLLAREELGKGIVDVVDTLLLADEDRATDDCDDLDVLDTVTEGRVEVLTTIVVDVVLDLITLDIALDDTGLAVLLVTGLGEAVPVTELVAFRDVVIGTTEVEVEVGRAEVVVCTGAKASCR
jgi:hypothetical protein